MCSLSETMSSMWESDVSSDLAEGRAREDLGVGRLGTGPEFRRLGTLGNAGDDRRQAPL